MPNEIDRLFVTAATFRDISTARREALAAEMSAGASRLEERVVVHTCHRVELIGVGDAAAELPATRVIRGPDAVERVLSVTAGFDSAVVAEEQVLGQVRDAYQTALARGETGPMLNELLRRAIRFGKRVRAEAQPGGDRSLADPAASWLLSRAAPDAHALLLGTGTIARLLARLLAEGGLRLTVASRDLERAAALVAALPGDGHRPMRTDPDLASHGPFDAIAVATRGAGADFARLLAGRPLVVDLSSPPVLEGTVAERLGDRLLDLDRLGRDGGMASALRPAAERRLRTELTAERDRYLAWLAERDAADAVAALRGRATALRARHLRRLEERGLLSGEQLAAVDAQLAALLAELLHEPTIELRRGGAEGDEVRRAFRIGA